MTTGWSWTTLANVVLGSCDCRQTKMSLSSWLCDSHCIVTRPAPPRPHKWGSLDQQITIQHQDTVFISDHQATRFIVLLKCRLNIIWLFSMLRWFLKEWKKLKMVDNEKFPINLCCTNVVRKYSSALEQLQLWNMKRKFSTLKYLRIRQFSSPVSSV